MLSSSKINNANGASKYYLSEDNYYLAEADAKESSIWWGEGASRLGISGKVNEKDLQNLLAGKLPNDQVIGGQKDKAHRAGYDLCFHAPKSVSILALDGGDERFYKAHFEAVKKTLHFMQRDCAQAKIYKDENIEFENTKNLTVALVKHITSRKLDPHLHTHALVMNATERTDKAWRALASSKTKQNGQVNGFMERFYNNQLYYGAIYKSYLADKVKELGCEIETVGLHGMWEIKGVPIEALEKMSKRRQEIEEKISELNYRSLKAQDVATLDTREEKQKDLKLDDLRKIWREELEQTGFSSEKFLAELKRDKVINADKIKLTHKENAKTAVLDAIEHISQYDLKLDYTKTITKAMEFAIGKCTHNDIVHTFDKAIENGKLIAVDKYASLFVTKEMIDTEKSIVDFVAKGKGFSEVINPKEKVINNIEDGQTKKSAIEILQSRDRINLVEHNNFDNRELVSNLLHMAESAGKTVRILSPNRLMANDTNQNIKRKPSSVWQWIVSLGKPELGESVTGFNHKYKDELDNSFLRFRMNKDIIIVDSAESLGSKDMQTMLDLTDKVNAKVIFINNAQAKLSAKAGNPVQTLMQARVKKFTLEAPKREMGFLPNVTEIKDDKERTRQIARDFAGKSDALVLVGANSQIKNTNEVIREELKNAGKLSRLEHKANVLNPVYLSKPESTLAKRYHAGMIIRAYENHGVEDWTVEKIYKGRNILKIGLDGKHEFWNPKTQNRNFSVFAKEELAIAKGDKLISTARNYELGIKSAEKFVVQETDDKYVTLANVLNGKTVHKIRLSELENSHFQHDYAATFSKSLKSGAQHVIADLKSYALDKTALNELTNRAKESLTIYTNDAENAKKRFDVDKIKITAFDTVLDASCVDRIVDDKTTAEIKRDIEKAVEALRPQDVSIGKKAVEFALEKITSRNAGFTHKHLVAEALEYALHSQQKTNNFNTFESVMQAINEKRNSGELVMGRYFNDGTRWTTKEILEQERAIIDNLKSGKDKVTSFLTKQKAKDQLNTVNNPVLTNDQKNACYLISTAKDQFVMVQGYAGTGKTTMFSTVQNMIKDEAKMLALAPTHRSVKELKSIGIEAQTLKSFLVEQNNKNDLDNRLIVFDEASMVSNEDFSQFLQIVGGGKNHVVLSGDIAQHIAIESGKPFEIIQKANILQTVKLKEIVRQKNPALKEAVENVISGDYRAAFDKIANEDQSKHIARNQEDNFFSNLRGSIVEVDNNKLKTGEKTLEVLVAEDYLSRTKEVRDKTAVIVHANHDRKTITDFIRKGLKEQGEVATDGVLVHCLTSKDLTNAEYRSFDSYQIGNVVKLGKEYYQVINGDKSSKSILLQDENGKTKYFYPEKINKHNVELYEHIKEELAVGDSIRFTKTNKELNRYANFEYKVKETANDRVIIQNKDTKETVTLNPQDLKDAHWDYAQTVTGYGIQGGSKTYAIDFEVSYRKNLANQRSFYIGASRAIQHLTIYTDNKENLINRITGNKGDKYAALEVTGELGQDDKIKKIAKTVHKKGDLQSKTAQKNNFSANQKNMQKLKSDDKKEFYKANEVYEALKNSAEEVLEKLLGTRNTKLSTVSEWRYGKKGSLAVKMIGDGRGIWHNFETGESGNLLTLLQKEMGINFKDALKYAANGFGNGVVATKKPLQNNEKTTVPNAKTYDKIIEYAKKLAQESQPIQDTIVEKYLKEIRGIKDLDSIDIKYHPNVFTGKEETQKYMPAMLAIGRDNDGNVKCVQATYLDSETGQKADTAVKKRTYASPAGNSVYLQKSDEKDKISCITEGVETGLSVKDAVKNSDVIAVLGKANLTHIGTENLGAKVVLCLDNDGKKSLADSIIHKAAERLISLGKEVYIAMPNQIKNNKTDFNDVARVSGISAVKDMLNACVSYKEWQDNLAKSGTDTKLNSVIDMAVTNNIANQKRADKELSHLALSVKNEQRALSQTQNNLQKSNDAPKQDMQKMLAKTEREIN